MKEYYKNIFVPSEKRLYSGVDAITNYAVGLYKNLTVKRKYLLKMASSIHQLSQIYSQYDDTKISKMIKEYKAKLRVKKVDDEVLKEAFALAVEICYRATDKRAYEVQILGALSIYKKYIIQMSTGEGKTLTASIGACVLAWAGKSVHIFTSNDYLSSRDAKLFSYFYARACVSVGCVISTTSVQDRKEIYKKNIVYSTAKEVLADFLKDRMQEEQNYNINTFLINKIANKDKKTNYLIRGLDTVIVDEADSVLADDAITPLIISAKSENKLLKDAVIDAHRVVQKLQIDTHYSVDERFYDVSLTDLGIDVIEANIYSLSEIWHSKQRREFLIKQAIIAKELYHLNKQYIIKDGQVVIIDEKTGRIMEGRSWGNGLHQAIEVKESLEITDPTITHSKMSFQRFFRLYRHLSGMSGTLSGLTNELWQIYGAKIIKIPTRVPSKMNILNDKIFINEDEKNSNLVSYIKEINQKNIPILIGVTSIKESEILAKKLKDLNIECTVLNALHDNEEAEIISKAGEKTKVTIATNMAGRGTDIHIEDEVNDIGGLHVILTQKDKSKRVDLQFFGRCARGGQNGTAVAFLSLQDNILQNYMNKKLLNYMEREFDNKYIKKWCVYIYSYYQYRIEKSISKIRNKILQNEFMLDDSMSYIEKSF